MQLEKEEQREVVEPGKKDKAWIKVTSLSVWSLTWNDATGIRYEEAADKLMGRRITAVRPSD